MLGLLWHKSLFSDWVWSKYFTLYTSSLLCLCLHAVHAFLFTQGKEQLILLF